VKLSVVEETAYCVGRPLEGVTIQGWYSKQAPVEDGMSLESDFRGSVFKPVCTVSKRILSADESSGISHFAQA
jgi:hypothetical protein